MKPHECTCDGCSYFVWFVTPREKVMAKTPNILQETITLIQIFIRNLLTTIKLFNPKLSLGWVPYTY
jgi:hypothetical protein